MAESQKRQGKSRGATNAEELEAEVFDAIRALGWAIPENEEEVKRAEAELAQEPVDVPDALRNADAVWNRVGHQEAGRQPSAFACNRVVLENLARAAREGGALTPEVEAQMRRDREQAEKSHDGEQ